MEFNEIIKAIGRKPYYQDDAVVIYHADCRDILPLIPDKSIDLVLTDPPYNVGLDYCNGDNNDKYKEWSSAWFAITPKPIVLTPGMVNLSMWFSIANPTWVIAWCKPNQCSPSALGGFNTWEPLLVYGHINKHIGSDSIIYSISTNQQDTGDHPCPKYQPAWSKILIMISKPSDLILDPFLGSGTTAYCAKKLGRKCIGIEIEEKYCEIAAKRCSQTVMNLEIPPVENAKQESLL